MFDFACHIHAFIAPWWTAIQIGFWVIVALAALWGLAKVKEIGGWPAVGGVLVAVAAALGYTLGRRRPLPSQRTVTIVTDDKTTEIQLALASRHLYSGEIDGKAGRQTQDGLNAVARSIGLPETPFDPDKLHVPSAVLTALGVEP